MEVSEAVKATLRMMGLLECCRLTAMSAEGKVDNDAVRLAVGRGASVKLGHMRKHAQVNLEFLRECGVPLGRVDTTENTADIFTKIVSAQRLEWHLARFTGAERLRNEHGSIVGCMHEEHDKECVRNGTKEVGEPKQVLACPCIATKKVLQLILVTSAMQLASAGPAERLAPWVELPSGGLELLKAVAGVLMILAITLILINMVPGSGGGGSKELLPTDDTDRELMLDGYAQLEGHIAAAQAVIAGQSQQMESTVAAAHVALAERDAVIAAQSLQIGQLSQQLATLSLRSAAAAGPAWSASMRGAVAIATSNVGGGSSSSAAAAAAVAAGHAACAASAAGAACAAAAAAIVNETVARELPTLSVGTERCRLPGCLDKRVGSTVFMTRAAGKKWHAVCSCTALRGREVVEYAVPF
jgi:hypothetical protein